MIRTDSDDRDLTESALSETGTDVRVKFISDLEELDSFVKKAGEQSLILLNDNDASHKGYDRLKQLKANPAYGHIPVVVLGELSTDDYVRQCYKAGANSFVVKPSTVADTNKKIAGFFNYWSQVAEVV